MFPEWRPSRGREAHLSTALAWNLEPQLQGAGAGSEVLAEMLALSGEDLPAARELGGGGDWRGSPVLLAAVDQSGFSAVLSWQAGGREWSWFRCHGLSLFLPNFYRIFSRIDVASSVAYL